MTPADEAKVPICNPTPLPITLRKGTILGELQAAELAPVCDDNIISPEIPMPPENGCPLKKLVQESHLADPTARWQAEQLLNQ